MIKLAQPDIKDTDIALAVESIKSGNLVQGIYVEKFEKNLENFSGIKKAVTVSSGTAALHLSLLALGIKPSDRVLVPAFTFPATANVVEIINAETVLADVSADSYVLEPEYLEEILQSSVKIAAIIIVHEFGYPAQIKRIIEIAQKYKVPVIEDAACALGTIADGQHVGFYGDIACLSFHPRKALTTGEGGAILTRHDHLAEKVKILRNHGMQKNGDTIDFVMCGLNYRMTDFQAALALGQLERFESELEKRKILAGRYFELLEGVDGVTLPQMVSGHSWQSFMVRLKSKNTRDRIINKLSERGVQSNIGAQALHCLTYFRDRYNLNNNMYPNSAELYETGLVLPLYGKLSIADIEYISSEFMVCLKKHEDHHETA